MHTADPLQPRPLSSAPAGLSTQITQPTFAECGTLAGCLAGTRDTKVEMGLPGRSLEAWQRSV